MDLFLRLVFGQDWWLSSGWSLGGLAGLVMAGWVAHAWTVEIGKWVRSKRPAAPKPRHRRRTEL